jgi:hypothetical protein
MTNVRLDNPTIHFLNPAKLPTPALKSSPEKQAPEEEKPLASTPPSPDTVLTSPEVQAFLAAQNASLKASGNGILTLEVKGKTITLDANILSKDNLIGALKKALGVIDTPSLAAAQAKVLQRSVSTLVAQIRNNVIPGNPNQLIHPLAPSEGRTIEAADQQAATTLEAISAEVDAAIAAGNLPAAERKAQIVARVLDRVGGENYHKLPPEQQKALQEALMGFDLSELALIEYQGIEGKNKGVGVTGTGTGGHYTPSLLSSVTQLLNTGRMTPEVVAGIKAMQSAPLHADLEGQRMALIRSGLQDIAAPHTIAQHSKGTCAAGTAQILYATREPAKYLQMLTDLASPEGQVRKGLLSGGTMQREKDTLKDDQSGRSVATRLVQPAFMEYGNGGVNYDNAKDKHSDGSGGLGAARMRRLLNGLFGAGAYTIINTLQGEVPEAKRLERIKKIDAHLNTGNPIPVNILWDDGAHEVLVTHIDRQSGMAYFMNPWGELHKMPLAELEKRMQDFTVPTAPGTGKPAHETLVPPANDLSAYSEVPGEKYRTLAEQIEADPDLNKLSQADQKTILKTLTKFKLDGGYLKGLKYMAQDGKYIAAAIQALGKAKTEDEAMAVLFAYGYPARGLQKGLFTREQADALVALRLDQRLSMSDLGSLSQAASRAFKGQATPEDTKTMADLESKARATANRQDTLDTHLQGLKAGKSIQQRLHKLMKTSPLAQAYHTAAMAADKTAIKRLDKLFTAIESWNGKQQPALSETQVAGLLQQANGLAPKAHMALLKALLKGDEAAAAKILGVPNFGALAPN